MKNISTNELVTSTELPAIVAADNAADISEEYLEQRFSRPEKKPEVAVCEFTRDVGFLHQYHRLRQEPFISQWGLGGLAGGMDDFDDSGDVIVARLGNHCVGGLRINYKTAEANLPLENIPCLSGVAQEPLPAGMIYAEIARFAVLPEYQNSLMVMGELFQEAFRHAADNNVKIAFILLPVMLSRQYNKLARHSFEANWHLRPDIDIPITNDFGGTKMLMSMIDLTPIHDARAGITTREENLVAEVA